MFQNDFVLRKTIYKAELFKMNVPAGESISFSLSILVLPGGRHVCGRKKRSAKALQIDCAAHLWRPASCLPISLANIVLTTAKICLPRLKSRTKDVSGNSVNKKWDQREFGASERGTRLI